ncbi:unnamed protein product [Adineta steineri]|uniref:Bms1-type G domain-containing protein n=5 Tax=Adineta steineri TaxID=433720 RepID=A0A813Z701_9BILA|nr:unnamed protein product [Adineta steineri]
MDEKHKAFRKPTTGVKAERRKKKKKEEDEGDNQQSSSLKSSKLEDAKRRNPKAFSIQNPIKAQQEFRRTQDLKEKRIHLPEVDRTPLEPPPVVVALVGPSQVGKSLLMKCLIKNFTRQKLTDIRGPVTIVSGRKRRITFIECRNDINSMIDVAKVADLVLLLIDAKFGFEMETFEFLNIAQVYGLPRIMGVLTHMDLYKKMNKQLNKRKTQLKHRFWTEIYQGAKLFLMSGMKHGEYIQRDVHNLARFISVMKFKPSTWKTTHPFVVADRMEDLTEPELIRTNPLCNRTASMFEFYMMMFNCVRINNLGCGDYKLTNISALPDPCGLPGDRSTKTKQARRVLNEKERLLYAPFSGVGGIVYDKDAIYIELGGSHSHRPSNTNEKTRPINEYVANILSTKQTIEEKVASSQLKLFADSEPVIAEDVQETERRRMKFETEDDDENASEDEEEPENDDDDDDEQQEDGDEEQEEDDDDDEQEQDNDDDDDEEEQDNDDDDDEEEEEPENDDEEEQKEFGNSWKENISKKFAISYVPNKAINWTRLVYEKGNEDVLSEEADSKNNNKEVGGLFIDIDSYECSLLQSILQSGYQPQIIHTEFNPIFAPPVIFIPIYNSTTKHDWNPPLWSSSGPFYGCSLSALSKLLLSFNYTLVELDFWDVIYIKRDIVELIQVQVPLNDKVAYEYGFMSHSCFAYCRGNVKLYNEHIDGAIKTALNQSNFTKYMTNIIDLFAPGAKLFLMSGMKHGEYIQRDVHNLARFISVMKFKPSTWKTTHPFVVADRMEDLTEPELIRTNPLCNRTVCLYGYVRGCCGDYKLTNISALPDPCGLPGDRSTKTKQARRVLNEKERLLYAPFSGVGGIVYDKDAIYIELGGSHSHRPSNTNEKTRPINEYVANILSTKQTIEEKVASSQLKLFADSEPVIAEDVQETERRRMKFETEDDDENASEDDEEPENDDDDDDEQQEDDDEEQEDDDEEQEQDNDDDEEEEEEEEEENDDEEEQKEFDNSWKENISKKFAISYVPNKAINWTRLVYEKGNEDVLSEEADSKNNNKEVGGLFSISKRKTINVNDQEDYTLMKQNDKHNWNIDNISELIRDCFVTGKWEKEKDAANLLAEDDEMDDDEDVFGDFEDLETGEKGTSENNKMDYDDDDDDEEKDPEDAKLQNKKAKLKSQFDTEYDQSKEPDSKYLDELRKEVDIQTKLNRSEFENMPDDERVQYEGYRPGMYVRCELTQIPCEFVNTFDPRYIVILGGMPVTESHTGYVQVRMKKHRWHKKILKCKDPLIISLGWRRFQTIPYYFMQDHNMRHRLLKYTPQHMYCHAIFYGPLTPQNTGFVAVQQIAGRTDFRVTATGVVIDLDKSTKIVKKIKLIGTPYKIFKKTAFIKGMFNTPLEVAKFQGASIRAVSGVRGQIKKVVKEHPGAFRATFEDKILLSDIIFLRAWFPLQVPKFYTPVTNLLMPMEQKDQWQGIRSVGQLKRDKNIRNEPNVDSLYKPIERRERVFRPLVIPTQLQRDLPFHLKPKSGETTTMRDPITEKQRVAVVLEPEEKKMTDIMKMFTTVYKDRLKTKQKTQENRNAQYKKQQKIQEIKHLQKHKQLKRVVYKKLGQMEGKKTNRNSRSKKNDNVDE